jgi:hypothetical protein
LGHGEPRITETVDTESADIGTHLYIKTNAMDVEKEWENFQNLLKSAPYESLRKIKRQHKKKFTNIG